MGERWRFFRYLAGQRENHGLKNHWQSQDFNTVYIACLKSYHCLEVTVKKVSFVLFALGAGL